MANARFSALFECEASVGKDELISKNVILNFDFALKTLFCTKCTDLNHIF